MCISTVKYPRTHTSQIYSALYGTYNIKFKINSFSVVVTELILY